MIIIAVMAGLVPAIHALLAGEKGVDARHKAGHDGAPLEFQWQAWVLQGV